MFKKSLIFIIFLLFLCPVFAKETDDGIKVIHKYEGIWVFKIEAKKYGEKIKPYVEYTTANELFERGNYIFVVNGGFFDMKDKTSVSYIVIDGKTVETPMNNLKLMEGLVSQKRDEAVLNRSEFRILEDEGKKISFDIAPHFAPVKEGQKIKHSIQGGPLIYPVLEWEKESFIALDKDDRVIFETCDVTKRRPRTLLGIKKDDLYVVIFTDKKQVALNEAYDFFKKKLKLDKVMAFDGGGSTSLNYKDIKIFSEGTEGRKVKSFLVIEGDK